jgi:hypothetical protein
MILLLAVVSSSSRHAVFCSALVQGGWRRSDRLGAASHSIARRTQCGRCPGPWLDPALVPCRPTGVQCRLAAAPPTADLGGQLRRDRPAVRRLPGAVKISRHRRGRRQQRAPGMGDAAREPAAPRLVALGRVVLYHRAAGVHARGAGSRAESRGHQRGGSGDVYLAAHARGVAGQGPGHRNSGAPARPDRGRHHARARPGVQRGHPAFLARPYWHPSSAAAHLADDRQARRQ